MPEAYSRRHQAGYPFSNAELIAIAKSGLMRAPDNGELSVPINSLNVALGDAPEDD